MGNSAACLFLLRRKQTQETPPEKTYPPSQVTTSVPSQTSEQPASEKMAFPAPAPKSLLGRHRLLAPGASVRVSPLSLGGMSLGNAWEGMMGNCTKEMAFELLDAYYDLGGNFIDTANVYHFGQSEQWIGEWMQKSGHRNEMVIATKYTMSPMTGQGLQESNFGGTGTKSMHVSIEASLKNLKTDYIDLVRACPINCFCT